MKIFIYTRVSTNEQNTDAQVMSLRKTAKKFDGEMLIEYTDTCSGSVQWRERKLLQVLQTANPGDMLIVPEISRIGRNTADVLDFLARAIDAKITVYIDKSAMTIGDNLQSKIFTTVMALTAEIERAFTIMRTKEGMESARQKGAKIGRPKGIIAKHKLDTHADQIRTLYAAGVTKKAIANLLKCSVRNVTTHYKKQGYQK